MKRTFLIGFFLFLVSALQAQPVINESGKAKIRGKVTDSISGSPLEYATVSLYKPGNKTPVTGATSDASGHFMIADIPAGTYNMLVEFIGYTSSTINNLTVDKNNALLDLKTIALTKNQQSLQNVTVIAQGKLIENKIDKLVFNAERDLTSQTGVATDVLKKVPQVSVDVDGNVELAGSSSIRFLINGKPSSAFGSNIADVLQAIPANQIKSIEVITNPGAKYDAQGLGGIINIILKKNTAKGINGNLSLSAGTRMDNGSFNFNARKGKLGVNAFISGNYRPAVITPSYSDRYSTDTAKGTSVLLHQDGTQRVQRHGLQSGLGFDWTYKEKNSFSGSFTYNQFGNSGAGAVDQNQVTHAQDGALLSDILSLNNLANSFAAHNIDADLTYKRTFKKEDQELEIQATSSLGNRLSSASNNQFFQPGDSLYYGTNNRNPGTENETEVQVNYVQPLKKDVSLGIGGKLNFLDITSTSDVLSLQPASKLFLPNAFLSNYLNYHQKVYALYSEMSFPVAHLFDAKIGGRYERTEISSFYSNAQTHVNTPGYNTFVPSVYFSKKIGDNQTVKMSYSKRIERPDYGDLNPFINTADPKSITAGNPYLQPEIGNRYELGYNRDFGNIGSVMVNLFYRANNHDIQPYIVYYPTLKIGDSTYTNVSVSTRENIGLEKNTGVNLFGDVKLASKFNVRTNLFFFYRHILNALDPGYDAHSFNYRLNMNASYQFSTTLAGEFFGNFNSPRNEVQGRYPSFVTYSFAFRKQFWNKKGSLALTATNPFNEYVNQRTEVFGPNFTLNSNRKIPFRSFGLNFTWKFGKLEFKKDKEENNNLNAPAEQ